MTGWQILGAALVVVFVVAVIWGGARLTGDRWAGVIVLVAGGVGGLIGSAIAALVIGALP